MISNLSYSPQKGPPGHCFTAQVFDGDGKNLAVIEPTDDPEKANTIARVFAASFDMLEAIEAALSEVPRGDDENCVMVHIMDVKRKLRNAYKKATCDTQ